MGLEGYITVEGGRVWYDRVSSENHNKTPLLVLHGGPGSAHLGMRPLETLADEREVIFYDQLGCGHSDRPTDKSLWTTERYVEELATLRKELNLSDVHILGHSWGTMLLCDYLLTKPTGVRSAIFSSPCLSAPRWVEDANRYREDLPAEIQTVLTRCEENGTTDSEEYEKAAEVYMKRHVCRVEVPKEAREARKWAFGEEVYQTMWGPSEFHATGVLKTYDRTNRLHEIKERSLFVCGEYDEASPDSTNYYHSLVAGSEFRVMTGCSHSPLREDPDAYLALIRAFLNRMDA
ncbi:proline iminopeptidase-family hydrolase [Alicyclobacillus ferrooxydans]|uniref:Proline iminopeptidase n=1 Tax=Alicyclobacillus ferrooxydans TaxID=471514 RepID=A0A0N8PPM7_9BACL|nr:proline iminopeptidase-family hydrolase [Alicyclobacillus ferrooxydans]KPV44757.1 proline iminopeptidase [Alicyclobacillus ferrooxydans]